MATYRLNVIFHGPFIFVVYGDHIEAFSPENYEHNFGVGNWREETPCKPKQYELKGIKKQNTMQGPDPRTHVIIGARAIPEMEIPQDADYYFKLPRPALMAALGLVLPGSPKLFTGDHVGKINIPTNPPILGSAHLFSYEIDPSDKPRLGGFAWVPRVKQVSTNLYAINLHIFSESPFDLGNLHPNNDFQLMRELLPGLSLELALPFPEVKHKPAEKVKDLGIDDPEQWGLRGSPNDSLELVPPRICDAPSLFVTM